MKSLVPPILLISYEVNSSKRITCNLALHYLRKQRPLPGQLNAANLFTHKLAAEHETQAETATDKNSKPKILPQP